MKKILTLLLLFSLVQISLFGQTCPDKQGTGGSSAVRWLNNGLFVMNWETSGANATYAALATSGTAISISGTIIGGTNDGNAFNLDLTQAEADDPNDTRIRPVNSANGNNGEAATFSGTITFFLDGGGTLVCDYSEGALPVDLISFNAKEQSASIVLNWQTASELNNDYFAIERSSNGRDFTEIAKQEGIGTSSEINNYAFEDINPEKGINYYRLRQVDFDGTTYYSHLVQAKFGNDTKGNELSVYPSVIQSAQTLMVDLEGFESSEKVKLSVININGKLMGSSIEVLAGQLISLPNTDLINGVYVLRVESATTVRSAKFVVKN